MAISFGADRIIVGSRRVDGTTRVSFDTGEYEVDNLAKIFPLQFEEKSWKITIEEHQE
jgi:hypothetical protein